MDAILRTVFNHFLQAFCEPLKKEGVELSFVDGLVVKDLVLRPEAINHELERAEADMRIEEGRIGLLRLCYTTLPGVVTMQMHGVDIRVRPNALKTLGRVMRKGLNDLLSPDDEEMLPHREHPIIDPQSRLILSPVMSTNYHQPGCPRHICGPTALYMPSDGLEGHAVPGYCPACHQMGQAPSQCPPPTASAPLVDNEIVYLSPKQMNKILKHGRTTSNLLPQHCRGITRRSDVPTSAEVPSLRRTISAKVHHHLSGHYYNNPPYRHHHSPLPSSTYDESSQSNNYNTAEDLGPSPYYEGARSHQPHCPLSRPRPSLRGCHQVCRPSRHPAQPRRQDAVSHSSDSVPQPRRRHGPGMLSPNLHPQVLSSAPRPPLPTVHPALPAASQSLHPPPPQAYSVNTLKQSPLRPTHSRSQTTWDYRPNS